ncbi:MAG: Nudix family hydrolase [Sterolibacteriaceae bacterium]|uniref:8-oxo-dGTP diphosphatase n=1 Tax=Candidatus Methylophosphatis roskildensis TaxID=2899263 RepID=A0A9D7E4R9_9PROT|nr:Nudix family hydrolase [Candidatus Methylophosphatis roskildensis]
MSRKIVDVAAAVITRADGCFLLGQRGPGSFYPGYWEFPGGKLEPGETPRDALLRELQEELGLRVETAWPWITREHEYAHAHVRLHFFEVPRWSGELTDHIHSALSWQRIDAVTVSPMLPANGPVLAALALPHEYAITHAWQIGAETQLAQIDAALARGLRLIQVREAALDAPARRRFAGEVVARAHAHGARVLINGDVALAGELDADGVHLPAAQLLQLADRPDLPLIGASCHDRDELDRAASLGADFVVLGPVRPTPTHAHQPGLGWPAFSRLAAGLPMPVFALGGLGREHRDAARAAGAHGVAAIRTAWN